MSDGIESEIGDKKATVDIMRWLTRTALELIGQGGLGVSMDTLGEPVHNPFAESIKMLVYVSLILILAMSTSRC